MTERQFGLTVANNHKLISRLRAGFGVNSQTHDRIMAFIETRSRGRAPAADTPKSKSRRSTRSAAASNTPSSSAERAA